MHSENVIRHQQNHPFFSHKYGELTGMIKQTFYKKECFANEECHNCGKRGHRARCCTHVKDKAKKNADIEKSVSSADNQIFGQTGQEVEGVHVRYVT
jgi:hypothetical protein